MKWEISDIDGLGRLGILTVNNKKMITPNLFPVVHPFKNLISSFDLKKIGAECIFTNAYIIYQNNQLKESVLKDGIHKHLGFDGIIATDSGAFQKYFYNNNNFNIKAIDIEKFQEKIESDFPVILDEPIQPNDDYDTAKNKIITTIQRAKENIKNRKKESSHWFGPIHGAKYSDLLRNCTIEMGKLDFSVFAIGGIVKLLLKYRFDLVINILLNVKKHLIPNKPIHMFGLGLPQFFSLAVLCGCDLMDSAAYILFAKDNRYFTLSTGTRKLDELVEFPCHCPVCCEYKPKELNKFDDKLRIELLAKHNLYLSFSELRTIRQAIKEGNLWELVEQRIRNHPSLVNAAKLIKSNLSFFEVYEKIYKNHGRIYTSQESFHRPLFYRYITKIKNNYRVPKKTKFLIILPELDVRGDNSPSIKKWLEKINKNQLIPREYLHISFISDFYGIIPLELNKTFPLGQYESFDFFKNNNFSDNIIIEKVEKFFKYHSKDYKKCGILVPINFINQFNEIVEFNKKKFLIKVVDILKSKYNLNISIFNDLTSLIQFFVK